MLFGCTVISYTHYPTISTDMLHRVESNRIMYNNKGKYKQLKIIYYKLFAHLYGFCGYFADIIMVNSTWTYNHINSIFYRSSSTSLDIVYPPCGNSQYLQEFELENRKKIILSVGQFRPEKDHNLQIDAFIKFRKKFKSKYPNIKLIMVGGCRDIEDKRRVTKLRAKINKYALSEYIVIKENLEWTKLLKLFQDSFIGLHTMEDEHFGICLAEYMVAGLITIGHCSGGPLTDIVSNLKSKDEAKQNKNGKLKDTASKPQPLQQSNETIIHSDGMIQTERGFLCTTVDQYAKCFEMVFNEYENGNGLSKMRQAARKYCVDRFSTRLFQEKFVNTIQSAFK